MKFKVTKKSIINENPNRDQRCDSFVGNLYGGVHLNQSMTFVVDSGFIRTSKVVSIENYENDKMTVQTRNTVYELERVVEANG